VEHGRLGQGCGERGREPAGVAPRGARSHTIAIDDRDAYALGLKEPRRAQSDHAGADDDNVEGLLLGHASDSLVFPCFRVREKVARSAG
jgi:hypothetical protein